MTLLFNSTTTIHEILIDVLLFLLEIVPYFFSNFQTSLMNFSFVEGNWSSFGFDSQLLLTSVEFAERIVKKILMSLGNSSRWRLVGWGLDLDSRERMRVRKTRWCFTIGFW